MKPIIIFGAGKVAEVVCDSLAADGRFEIAGVTCNREHISRPDFEGWEIVPFDEIETIFPPTDFQLFVALGYQRMNDVRAERAAQARAKGYRLASCVLADLPDGVEAGENCFVMNRALIQPRVRLGHNVFVWSGALVGHHSVIGDNCWLTSAAAVCGNVTVGANCFLAANATIGNGVRIGNRCFLGANALVTKDLPESSVVAQQPSQVLPLTSDQFIRMSTFR